MRTADPVKDPSAEVDDLRVPGCAIAATTKHAESAFRANLALAGPAGSITLCDSRRGTGVWLEFRERPQSARTSAPLTAGHLGTAMNTAGLLPARATVAAGSPPSAAAGPARARCRTCARKGPVSGRGGPGHWRPSGRRRRPGPGVRYRGKVVSRGRLRRRFRSPSEAHYHPGRPAGLRRSRGPGRADPGLIVEGSRCPAPRPGSTARQ